MGFFTNRTDKITNPSGILIKILTHQPALKDSQGMTNSETARAITGVVVTAGAAATSYAEQIEQYLRMGASLVAIVSGVVVIWSVLWKHYKKKSKS